MPKRTTPTDYQKVEKAEDLDEVVKDKRTEKRATKQKAKQRNRRYGKRMLHHLREFGLEEE